MSYTYLPPVYSSYYGSYAPAPRSYDFYGSDLNYRNHGLSYLNSSYSQYTTYSYLVYSSYSTYFGYDPSYNHSGKYVQFYYYNPPCAYGGSVGGNSYLTPSSYCPNYSSYMARAASSYSSSSSSSSSSYSSSSGNYSYHPRYIPSNPSYRTGKTDKYGSDPNYRISSSYKNSSYNQYTTYSYLVYSSYSTVHGYDPSYNNSG